MAKCANFQTLLLAFVILGILTAGAAVVSFAMMCRHHLRHIHEGDGGIKICNAVYRPGDNTMAFAEVLRMVLAFVAITTVFVFCGVCCCYRLKVARDQNQHLRAVLKGYNLGTHNEDMNKEFEFYLSTALKSHLADSHVSIRDKDVKINLMSTPETVSSGPSNVDTVDSKVIPSLDEDVKVNLIAATVGNIHIDGEDTELALVQKSSFETNYPV